MHPTIAHCVLAQSAQKHVARPAQANWSARLMHLVRSLAGTH